MPTPFFRPVQACLLATCAALAACSRPAYGEFNQPHPAGAKRAAQSTQGAVTPSDNNGVIEAHLEQVQTMTRDTTEAPPEEYVIGPRDELMIEVAPHEMAGTPSVGTDKASATIGTSSRTGRTVVHDDGNIQLLGVGDFKAAGLTVTQLADALKKEYTKVIKDPEVIIEIQSYRSQIAYLGGQFAKPGPMPLERRTDMLQLISMAGNPAPNANVRGAYVQRKSKDGRYKMLPVDLYSLLEEGDITQNIWILPNDFIYIPDNSKQVVYMLGNINKVGPLNLHKDGSLTLVQAVVESGGVRSFGTDWNKVRIIRSHTPTRGEFIVVDYQKMVDGEVMPFQLQAGDVVYFANTRLGDWNEALNAIQPSLQLVGNVLQPFVQLKVLEQTFKN